jgi:hypothetical protein
MEPGGDWFNGVFLTMPNHVSLRIQINDVRGLIQALDFMEASDSAVVQSLDPFGRLVNSVAQGNVKLGDLSVVGNVTVGGSFELVFIVFDAIV